MPSSTLLPNIKGFIETSFVDWPERLSAVLFLPGCTFRCPYCHNAELALGAQDLPDWPFASILKRLGQLRGWVDSVCISGGEPTIHSYLPQLCATLKENGFKTKLDTNGSNPQMLDKLTSTGLVDFVAMDVKAPLDQFSYAQCTGVIPPLDNIQKSINILIKGGIPYQFRTTIVPKLHTINDVLRLAEQVRGAMDYRLQNFNPSRTLDPSFQGEPPYDHDTFRQLQRKVQHIVSLSALEARLQA